MKNTKKLSAMALTGLMGFSLLGSPVMAATENGKADSKVFYTTNSNTIDADGKVVMVIPADMNLNKNKLTSKTSFKLKTSNGESFDVYAGFSAKVKVTSKNNGKLMPASGSGADYKLNNDNENKPMDWGNPSEEFIKVLNAETKGKAEVERVLSATVDAANSEIMEKAASGTQFSDVLTYKVTELTGAGLNYSPAKP